MLVRSRWRIWGRVISFVRIKALEKNPKIAVEIEQVIREQATAISKELEGNPSPKEKISKKEED